MNTFLTTLKEFPQILVGDIFLNWELQSLLFRSFDAECNGIPGSG
nr:hypothetical protein [uncultured Sphaerochaeta sp.]